MNTVNHPEFHSLSATNFFNHNLAYVYQAGFTQFIDKAGIELLEILRENGISSGLLILSLVPLLIGGT